MITRFRQIGYKWILFYLGAGDGGCLLFAGSKANIWRRGTGCTADTSSVLPISETVKTKAMLWLVTGVEASRPINLGFF